MRAVGLSPDVVVVTSRVFQTNAVLVRGPGLAPDRPRDPREEAAPAEDAYERALAEGAGEAFLIDSPILPDELEILPSIASQARFAVAGLLATHGDWDHLLGAYAFPDAPLGCAESTGARLGEELGGAQRALRDFDDAHYVERPKPFAMPGAQTMPVPGRCGLGEAELELFAADGHTADGMVVWIAWAEVLIVGDYLSSVEIPMLSPGGSADAYLATLARLEPLVANATAVVPGHGAILDSGRAMALLREDRSYVESLVTRGSQATLPIARRTREQKRIHAENAARV